MSEVLVDIDTLRVVLDALADPNPRPPMSRMVAALDAQHQLRALIGDRWDEQTGKWVRVTDRSDFEARLDAQLRAQGFEPCPFEEGCITWIKPDDQVGHETHRREWHPEVSDES